MQVAATCCTILSFGLRVLSERTDFRINAAVRTLTDVTSFILTGPPMTAPTTSLQEDVSV